MIQNDVEIVNLKIKALDMFRIVCLKLYNDVANLLVRKLLLIHIMQ